MMISGTFITPLTILAFNGVMSDVFSDAGWLVPTIAIAWIVWQGICTRQLERENLLHPKPLVYPVNCQQAFSAIHRILKETSYNYGDKWQIVTADVTTNRILADLRFTDEETSLQIGSQGQVHQHTNRLHRYLRCEVQFNPINSESTEIHLEFKPTIEGLNSWSCDSIVCDLQTRMNAYLGVGNVEV